MQKRDPFRTVLEGEEEGDSPTPPTASGGRQGETVRQLFQRHNRVLIGFLAARLKSTAEAKDVAQEAYARLLQLDGGSTVSFPRAYLFRIAANLAANRIRHRSVQERHVNQAAFEELLSYPSPESSVGAEQQIEVVKAALLELPERGRKAFALHFFGEQSVEDVASVLRITPRMVRMHLARALEHVRAALEEASEEVQSKHPDGTKQGGRT